MRKIFLISGLLVTAAIVGVGCQKEIKEATASDSASSLTPEAVTTTGNGAPSGAHYNLNIIGVPKNKSVDFTGGNGRRIFVPLYGKTKILLYKGDFDVIDANGTDGTAAFQLPEPDATDDGITDYSVYIRGLGKPGGSATMQSCYWDQQTSTEYCSTGEYIVNVTAHGGKFTNVTNQLLYVWADVDADGNLDRIELFSDPLDTYYWYYDNNGLKIAQLRFYPGVGTPVGG